MKRLLREGSAIVMMGALLTGACARTAEAPDSESAQVQSDSRTSAPITSQANPTTTRAREAGCQGVLGVETADSPATTNALGDVSPETERTIPFAATWTGEHFQAVGQEKRGEDDHAITYTSKDGVSWQTGATGQATGLGSGPMVSMGGRYFLVVLGSHTIGYESTSGTSNLFMSPDGANWTAVPESGIQEQYPEDFKGIATNGRVLVASDGDGRVFSSTDGTSWAKVLPKGNEKIRSAVLTANATGFVVAQSTATESYVDDVVKLWFSSDGVNWDDVGAANPGLVLNTSTSKVPSIKVEDAVATQKQFVIAGTETREGGNDNGVVWFSSDGRKWESTSEQTDVPFTGPGDQAIDTLVAGPDFVIVNATTPNGTGRSLLVSRDMRKWSPISLPVDLSSAVGTAASDDGLLLLSGYDTAAFCRS